MITLPLNDFIGRVMTSQERVQFSQVDPYGHLNTSRYTEFIVNHRVMAVEDQVRVSTLDIMKTLGVAFVVTRLDTRFHLPSFLGESLEIASWVESIHKSGFDIRIVVSGTKNKKVRTTAQMEIRTVDVKTGRPVDCPPGLPTRGEADILSTRPTADEYLKSLEDMPKVN